MNMFRNAATGLRNSAMVIPIYIAFIALFIVGAGLFLEDYNTSLYGYIAIPTLKYGGYVVFLVAILPQIGQICFGYFYGYDNKKMWALAVALGLFLLDSGTDVVYKIDGNYALIPIAFIETILVYTLGSEIAIIVSAGMLLELFPDFMRAAGDIAERLERGIGHATEARQRGGGSIYPEFDGDEDFDDEEDW